MRTARMSQWFHNVTLFYPSHNALGSSRGWLERSTGADKHFHRLLSISLSRWNKMRVHGVESRVQEWCTTSSVMCLTLNDWRNYGCEPRVGGTAAWEWIFDQREISQDPFLEIIFEKRSLHTFEERDDRHTEHTSHDRSNLLCCNDNYRNTKQKYHSFDIKFHRMYQFSR